MSLATDILTFAKQNEGINDRRLFKSVVFAGGPGAGKSFVLSRMVSKNSGVKVVNPDELFELAGANLAITGNATSDVDGKKFFQFYRDIKTGKMSINPEIWYGSKDLQNYRASRLKMLLKTGAAHWINGMLPLAIDGTGKDFNKIKKQKDFLTSIGYDVSMIFVNTTLDVALERNRARSRQLPDVEVTKNWMAVQANLGSFQDLFRSDFYIIDNSDANQSNTDQRLSQITAKVFDTPLQNKIGRNVLEALKLSGGKLYSDVFTDIIDVIKTGMKV